MNFKKHFKELKAQKQIDKLARKYRKKKVVIYGAGQFCKILFDNYDLSKLNIVAVADKSFARNDNNEFYGLNCITPNDLKEFGCDIILIGAHDICLIGDFLEDELLIDCKNSKTKIRPLIKESFWKLLKELFNEED